MAVHRRLTHPIRSILCSAAVLAALLQSAWLGAQTPTASTDRASAAPQESTAASWYKHAVVYEIYPRSFQDSDGNGLGDLNGITQRLGYLESIGVDAIWIAPMYPSPQVDFGYDISNYTAVDPQYGTLADFDRLVAAARQHGIRVMLDMVLNHTSDKHPWFVDSASSRTNPHADWYVWSDGVSPNAAGVTDYQRRWVVQSSHGPVVPPTNWVSLFGGSAWEWVPARQQFYYHKFYKQQPDLNWRNPAVEKAMFGAMRFWLDRGVAGFRLDAIPTLFEDPQLRDEPIAAPGVNAQNDPFVSDIYTNMLPEVHDVLRQMRVMTDSYGASGFPGRRVLIGETYLPNTAALLRWYGTPSQPEVQLPMDTLVGFHTEGGGPNSPNTTLSLPHFRDTLQAMETELPASDQPLLVFDNHDNPRSWDRFCTGASNPQYCPQIARLIATILFTTRSTALMYYGQEIGMTTHTPTRREDVQDPIGITGWPKQKGRDGERTPMQWTPSPPAAGFSTNSHTWLPVGADYPKVNVATETADSGSLLSWYRKLTAIRRTNATLHDGGFKLLDAQNPDVLTYVRTPPPGSSAHAVVVSLNFTAEPRTVHLDTREAGIASSTAKALLSDGSGLNGTVTLTNITLPPYGSLVAEVQ